MEDRSKFIDQLKREKKILRITFLGDGAVGKTTLVSQFLNKFGVVENQLPSEERTPFMNVISWKQGDFTIQCFDLAGQRIEKAHPIELITKQVLGGLDIIFFVFTLDRFASFENIETWYNLAENNEIAGKVKYYLVGNKCDLEQIVNQEMIDNTIKNGMFTNYISTSAVTEDGISSMIDIIEDVGKQNLILE